MRSGITRAISGRSGRRLIIVAPFLVQAAFAADIAREPIQPSFHEAVEIAWSLLPDRSGFAARQHSAEARAISGRALFPNAPSLSASHVNDKILGSNLNYITTQAELGTPIWLPGEGSATVATARADAAAVDADADAAHLALASRVLDVTVEAAQAGSFRQVAERRLATARVLAADVARRVRIGEQPQTDALAAEAEAASAQGDLAIAEADSAAALASVVSLTGLEAAPSLPPPYRAGAGAGLPGEALLARHPRILAGQRAVQAAEENARLVRIADRDDPELGFQGINEKQPGTRWDTRFGVTLRFSFATEARNAPRRAAAEQQVTEAMVRLDLARREVLALVRAQRASLIGAEKAAGPARQAAEALDMRRDKIERAWRLGEMPLVEVVRANALAFNADLARERARLALDTASARLSIAEGVLP